MNTDELRLADPKGPDVTDGDGNQPPSVQTREAADWDGRAVSAIATQAAHAVVDNTAACLHPVLEVFLVLASPPHAQRSRT